MKFETMICPECGEPAKGTSEMTPGCAVFLPPDEHGHVEHCGETEMYWDGQQTVSTMKPDGEYAELQCADGHLWESKVITWGDREEETPA